MYLSKRYNVELNRNALCKFTPALFSSSSITLMFGYNNFPFLEKRFHDSIKELWRVREEICCDNKTSQRTKRARTDDIDIKIDFYKRCLVLLDFYKRV